MFLFCFHNPYSNVRFIIFCYMVLYNPSKLIGCSTFQQGNVFKNYIIDFAALL